MALFLDTPFSISPPVSSSSTEVRVAVGDLNGDGFLDVVVCPLSLSATTDLHFFSYDLVSRTLTPRTVDMDVPFSVDVDTDCCLFDLDGDGIPELFQSSIDSVSGDITIESWSWGASNPQLSKATPKLYLAAASSSSTLSQHVCFMSLHESNYLCVLSSSSSAGSLESSVEVYRVAADLSLSHEGRLLTGMDNACAISVADVDGDGMLEMVVVSKVSVQDISVMKQFRMTGSNVGTDWTDLQLDFSSPPGSSPMCAACALSHMVDASHVDLVITTRDASGDTSLSVYRGANQLPSHKLRCLTIDCGTPTKIRARCKCGNKHFFDCNSPKPLEECGVYALLDTTGQPLPYTTNVRFVDCDADQSHTIEIVICDPIV